jgi:hypothetical protein
LLRPGLIVAVLLVLILSHSFYAFWPYRRRSYPAVVLLTVIGLALGQGWQLLGLPSLRLGEVNLLPAVALAALLQPLASRLALTRRAKPR